VSTFETKRALSTAGVDSAYLWVVSSVAWPGHLWICASGIPHSSRGLATQCLRGWR